MADDKNILEKIFRRFNGFDKILTTTAMLFMWLKSVSNMTEATEKAKMFLIGKQELTTKEIDLIKRNFIYKKIGDIHYALSRSYMENQQVNQKKLVVISGSSDLGQKILWSCHIHCSGPSFEVSNMMKKQFYITNHRPILKTIATNCMFCLKMRRKAEFEEMGPMHALAAGQSGVVLGVAFCDLLGPVKLKTKRGAPHGKAWIMVLNCVWSRLCLFIPVASCSAAAVLKAIVTAANMTGGSLPSCLYSDNGSSILPLQQLGADADTGEDLIRDLKTT